VYGTLLWIRIDRWPLPRMALALALGLAASCVALALSAHVAMLFLSFFLLRHFGQGLMTMTAVSAMVRYLAHHKGKATALCGLGFPVAEALLPPLAIALLTLLGWRQSWLLWAALLLATLPLAIHFLLRGHRERHSAYLAEIEQKEQMAAARDVAGGGQRQWTRPEVLGDTLFYLVLPLYTAMPLLFTGFMFHQIHLVEEKGWALAIWSSLFFIHAGTQVVLKLASGLLIDRYGAIRLLPLVAIPLTLSLVVLGSSERLLAAVGFMLFIGISSGTYTTLASPFLAEMYGSRHLGAIKSLATSVMVFASAVSPVVMGWLIDSGVSMDTMACGSALYVVAAGLLARFACRAALDAR